MGTTTEAATTTQSTSTTATDATTFESSSSESTAEIDTEAIYVSSTVAPTEPKTDDSKIHFRDDGVVRASRRGYSWTTVWWTRGGRRSWREGKPRRMLRGSSSPLRRRAVRAYQARIWHFVF